MHYLYVLCWCLVKFENFCKDVGCAHIPGYIFTGASMYDFAVETSYISRFHPRIAYLVFGPFSPLRKNLRISFSLWFFDVWNSPFPRKKYRNIKPRRTRLRRDSNDGICAVYTAGQAVGVKTTRTNLFPYSLLLYSYITHFVLLRHERGRRMLDVCNVYMHFNDNVMIIWYLFANILICLAPIIDHKLTPFRKVPFEKDFGVHLHVCIVTKGTLRFRSSPERNERVSLFKLASCIPRHAKTLKKHGFLHYFFNVLMVRASCFLYFIGVFFLNNTVL